MISAALQNSNTECEHIDVQLEKDEKGLGITIAGVLSDTGMAG